MFRALVVAIIRVWWLRYRHVRVQSRIDVAVVRSAGRCRVEYEVEILTGRRMALLVCGREMLLRRMFWLGHGRWRRGIAILVLAGHCAQCFETVGGIRWIGRLCQLSRKVIITPASSLLVSAAHAVNKGPIVVEISTVIVVFVWVVRVHESEITRYVHPCCLLRERLFISVKVLQAAFTVFARVHRWVLLVSEGDASGGDALAASLYALRAYWSLFAALQLEIYCVSVKKRCGTGDLPFAADT